MRGGDLHPQLDDPLDLVVEHVARHPVGRDPVAHHPARLLAGVADLDLVAESRQVIGGGQATRPGPDHQHALAGGGGRRIERPALLPREVTEEPLDRVDRDGAVEIGAVANALARVVTDPPVDRRERVVGDQLAPGQLVVAGLRVRQPRLDVLARGAARVARRQQIDVHRSALADRPARAWPCTRSGSCVTSCCSPAHIQISSRPSSRVRAPPRYSCRGDSARPAVFDGGVSGVSRSWKAFFGIGAHRRRNRSTVDTSWPCGQNPQPSARLPPTALRAPRGERRGVLVLTAGPVVYFYGVIPPPRLVASLLINARGSSTLISARRH